MLRTSTLSLAVALSASGYAFAQSGGMNHADMKGMETGKPGATAVAKAPVIQASGVVKAANPAKGTVTLAHDPIKSLNWPAMTMAFGVKEPALFDKLPAGKKVSFEFVQQDSANIITAVK